MIKSSERKNTNPSASQSCFEKSDHGLELGISFEKKDGSVRFALYSFLSAVDFDGSEKLVFRYTFGTVTIQGCTLQPIWKILRQGSLARISEGGNIPSNETSISSITMVDFADASPSEPKFPGEES